LFFRLNNLIWQNSRALLHKHISIQKAKGSTARSHLMWPESDFWEGWDKCRMYCMQKEFRRTQDYSQKSLCGQDGWSLLGLAVDLLDLFWSTLRIKNYIKLHGRFTANKWRPRIRWSEFRSRRFLKPLRITWPLARSLPYFYVYGYC